MTTNALDACRNRQIAHGKPRKSVIDPRLEAVRASCRKSRSTKKISRTLPVLDGRQLCRSRTRATGHECTFRARTLDGYCKRHDPHGKSEDSSKTRRQSSLEKRQENEKSLELMQKNDVPIPFCPQCSENSLEFETDKKYFGMSHFLCTNSKCCKRVSCTTAFQLGCEYLEAQRNAKGKSVKRGQEDSRASSSSNPKGSRIKHETT